MSMNNEPCRNTLAEINYGDRVFRTAYAKENDGEFLISSIRGNVAALTNCDGSTPKYKYSFLSQLKVVKS